MREMRIALVQICPDIGKIKSNTEKILFYLKQAVKEGAELVVFPECSLTGYGTENVEKTAVWAENEQVVRIREYGKESGLGVCFGYIERTEQGFYITQELCFGGRSIRYRKTHLGMKEKTAFLNGSEFPVMNAPLCTGMQLCWESHIPEISAMERKQGAELLLMPYASPMSKERCSENWNVHLPARASDNGAFTAAANLLFKAADGTKEMRGGGLAVYDPKGKRIAACFETDEQMLICDLKGPLPREIPEGDMHQISYFDRKREELF